MVIFHSYLAVYQKDIMEIIHCLMTGSWVKTMGWNVFVEPEEMRRKTPSKMEVINCSKPQDPKVVVEHALWHTGILELGLQPMQNVGNPTFCNKCGAVSPWKDPPCSTPEVIHIQDAKNFIEFPKRSSKKNPLEDATIFSSLPKKHRYPYIELYRYNS